MKHAYIVGLITVMATFLMGGTNGSAAGGGPSLEAIEARVLELAPHPDFKDDGLGIIVIRQALISLKEGSGGIGACLVDERTGKLVATGRNRQYRPYFRSDLHAEMDLLTRYEDWLRKKGGKASGADPRDCDGLVLVSSVEPCPMCLTRIINAGIKKMVYVSPDEMGGMVSRMDQLPPFWKTRARQCEYRKAVCSPKVQQLARDLFNYSMRDWGIKKKGMK
jgi:cytosine deaminase